MGADMIDFQTVIEATVLVGIKCPRCQHVFKPIIGMITCCTQCRYKVCDTMTRSEQLEQSKLYECTTCGRMDYRPQGWPTLPCCTECELGMELVTNPSASQHFDAIAQTFYRETGCIRPGKDVPAVLSSYETLQRYREKWVEWNNPKEQRFCTICNGSGLASSTPASDSCEVCNGTGIQ